MMMIIFQEAFLISTNLSFLADPRAVGAELGSLSSQMSWRSLAQFQLIIR